MIFEENKSLRSLNTFGIEAAAKYFTEVNSEEELQELQGEKIYKNNPKLILGGGSNILLTKDFDGLVIRNNIPGIEGKPEADAQVLVKAGAGVVWHSLVLWTIERQLGGIENLSLIPGRAGACPIQNIGAYGVEIKDVLTRLEAIHLHTGEKVTFTNNDCSFGYRDSIFKNKYRQEFVVTSVTLRLTQTDLPQTHYHFKTDYGDIRQMLEHSGTTSLSVKAISDAVIKIRSSKLPDPKVLPNAGSFFKNPIVSAEQFQHIVAEHPSIPHYRQHDDSVKIPAGWLIEQCGWKGKRIGQAGMHERQSLVLVNYGNATGAELLRLSEDVRQSVQEKFGIALHSEVNVI